VQQRQLGRTGTWVSAFCLGTANFGAGTEESDAIETVHAALDAGVSFVDTANVYGTLPGQSETMLGRALKGRRDSVVLASKVISPVGDGPNDRGGGFRHVVMQCEASLRRLQTDWLDLYQLHAWDSSTPLEETLRALDHLISQGKVRYVGTSNFAAWQVVEALWTAERQGLKSPPVTEQTHYSLLHRLPETELFPMAEAHDVGLLVYSPLSAGILTGKYQAGIPSGTRFAEQPAWAEAIDPVRLRNVVGELGDLATASDVTLQQLALAWVASRSGVTSVILGPRNARQLLDNLSAVPIEVSAEVAARVDAIVTPGTTMTP
jgi:aryl-alcohol dehydrogenase-like predicted oxidoreductase